MCSLEPQKPQVWITFFRCFLDVAAFSTFEIKRFDCGLPGRVAGSAFPGWVEGTVEQTVPRLMLEKALLYVSRIAENVETMESHRLSPFST